MRLRFAAAVAAIVVYCSPGGAEPLRLVQMFGGEPLPPFEVVTIIRSMGMNPLDRPVWRQGRYFIDAIDRTGREVEVSLDARSGQVLTVTPLGYGRPAPRPAPRYGYEPGRHDPRYGPRHGPEYAVPLDEDDDWDEDERIGALPPPSPPPVIRAPQTAARPQPRAPEPEQAPLPRPRPDTQQAAGNATQAAPPAPAKPGEIRQIEIYRKPQDSRPDAGTSDPGFPPVQPLDDTPSQKPNI